MGTRTHGRAPGIAIRPRGFAIYLAGSGLPVGVPGVPSAAAMRVLVAVDVDPERRTRRCRGVSLVLDIRGASAGAWLGQQLGELLPIGRTPTRDSIVANSGAITANAVRRIIS